MFYVYGELNYIRSEYEKKYSKCVFCIWKNVCNFAPDLVKQ